MRRHPGDELRVLIGGLAVAAGGLAARHGHVFAFDTNLFRLVNELPDALGRPLLVVMHLGALAAVPVMAGVALAARRPRLSRDLALSGGLAWLLANMVKDVVGEARPVALLGGVVVRAFTTGAAIRPATPPWRPRWRLRPGPGCSVRRDGPCGGWPGWWPSAGCTPASTCHSMWPGGWRWAGRWPPPPTSQSASPGGLPTPTAILEGLRAARMEPDTIQPAKGVCSKNGQVAQ